MLLKMYLVVSNGGLFIYKIRNTEMGSYCFWFKGLIMFLVSFLVCFLVKDGCCRLGCYMYEEELKEEGFFRLVCFFLLGN